MLRIRLVAAGLAIAAVAAVVGSACGGGGGGGGGVRGNWSINDAKEFSDYSLYWVGEKFEGQSLSEIFYDAGDIAPTDEDVLFSYGSCRRNRFSGECEYPLWIQTKPRRAGPPPNFPASLRIQKGDVVVTIGGSYASLVRLAADDLDMVNEAP